MGARRLLFWVTRMRLGSRNYRKVKWDGCEVGGSGGEVAARAASGLVSGEPDGRWSSACLDEAVSGTVVR